MKENHRDVYHWYLNGADATVRFLRAILPYLVIKKSEAMLACSASHLVHMRDGAGKKLIPEVEEVFAAAMRSLKNRDLIGAFLSMLECSDILKRKIVEKYGEDFDV